MGQGRRLSVLLLVLLAVARAAPPAAAAPAKSMGYLVLDFRDTPSDDTYVAVDVATGATKSLGIWGYADAGFNPQLTKAVVVQILVDNGREGPLTSRLLLTPLDKRLSTTLWTFHSGQLTSEPTWSPNGSQIALGLSVAGTDGGTPSTSHPVRPGLWVIDVRTHHRRLVVSGDVAAAAWNPDGRRIAYLALNQAGLPVAVDTVPVTGNGHPRRIANLTNQNYSGTTTISWSPDGRTLAVDESTGTPDPYPNTGVVTYPAKGGRGTTILPFVRTTTRRYAGAAYLPGGKALVVAAFPDPPPVTSAPQSSASATVPAAPPTTPSAGPPSSSSSPTTAYSFFAPSSLPTRPHTMQILTVRTQPPYSSHRLFTLPGNAYLVGWVPG